jgi:hypothetical protein
VLNLGRRLLLWNCSGLLPPDEVYFASSRGSKRNEFSTTWQVCQVFAGGTWELHSLFQVLLRFHKECSSVKLLFSRSTWLHDIAIWVFTVTSEIDRVSISCFLDEAKVFGESEKLLWVNVTEEDMRYSLKLNLLRIVW